MYKTVLSLADVIFGVEYGEYVELSRRGGDFEVLIVQFRPEARNISLFM